MFYNQYGTTYNALLTEFVNSSYEPTSREGVIKTIKATFKKLTGFSINSYADDSNRQQVLDILSNAKIPHCTFADWLRRYEWKTPQQSENKVALETPEDLDIDNLVVEVLPEPQPEPLKVIDVFVAVYGESSECFKRIKLFIENKGEFNHYHGIKNPWQVVDTETEKHLASWFGSITIPKISTTR